MLSLAERNPALYQRPELQLNVDDFQTFQHIRDGTGPFTEFVAFEVIDGITQRVYDANAPTRPWIRPDAARTLLREAAFEGKVRDDPLRAGYEIFVDSGCIHGVRPKKSASSVNS